jgi:hypothetical protein
MEPKKALDVKNYYKFRGFFFTFENMVIMVSYSFIRHECQETQIRNPFVGTPLENIFSDEHTPR